MPFSIHNKEDGSVSAEQLLHEAGFSARCPWLVGVCASYILSSFTLRWNYTQQAEKKTSMLNEKSQCRKSCASSFDETMLCVPWRIVGQAEPVFPLLCLQRHPLPHWWQAWTSSPKCQSAGVPTWQFNCNWWCEKNLICDGKKKKRDVDHVDHVALDSHFRASGPQWVMCREINHPQDFREVSASCGPGRGLWGGSVCPGLCQAREILLPATNVKQYWIPMNTDCWSSKENHTLPIKKRARAGHRNSVNVADFQRVLNFKSGCAGSAISRSTFSQ